MVRFQVLHNDQRICKESDLAECETVLDIKKLINSLKGFDLNAQVLSFENVLLLDNFKLSQLTGPSLPPTGEKRSSPSESITTLVLNVAQGKCILDINLFLGNNSQKIELVIPSSIIVENLIEQIISAAHRLDLP